MVLELSLDGNRRWKKEMTNTKKKTAEHLSIVNGIWSEKKRTEAEKIAGKKKRAKNDCAESPFSMVKGTKRVCGTNMSI